MGEDERIWTFTEICGRYADGERDFRGLEIGQRLSDWRQPGYGTFRGADFTGAAIDSATFRSARLDGAVFAGATSYGYVFTPDEYPDDDGRPRRR